jgi:hypothetical protein
MDDGWRSQGVYHPRFSDIQASESQRYGYLSVPQVLINANRLDNVPFLYFIVFSDGYTRYQTYDASVKPVGEEIALLR